MIGVVADDLTGAADVGGACASAGFRTNTLLLEAAARAALDDADAVVIDTESRHLPPARAYERVRQAVRLLHAARVVYKKICSAFRGNIGAETDAALDELDLHFVGIAPAFPAQGRTTTGGRHYIHGRPLHETEMADDPLAPVTDSSLPHLLRSQTRRPVHVVSLDRHDDVERLRQQGGMAIFDAVTQTDLARVAHVLAHDRLVCGASALARELVAQAPLPERAPALGADVERLGAAATLVVSGSASPIAQAQIEALAAAGHCCVAVRPESAVGDPADVEAEAGRVTAHIADSPGARACIFTPPSVARTQREASRRGLDRVAAGDRVARLLAECARRAVATRRFGKLIVFGGSTAVAVFRALGMVGQRILADVEPGVPSSLSIGGPKMLVVLKPGSFGGPDFVEQADQHLRQLTSGS